MEWGASHGNNIRSLHNSRKYTSTVVENWKEKSYFTQKPVIVKSHWDKNPSENSPFGNLIYHKIYIFKISFFTKFTLSNSQFWQNSHFHNLIFHKIHILKISFFTKFTFLKYHFSQNSRFFISIFTKFTLLKSHFSQNSRF